MDRLNALWAEIAEFGRNLQNVPLSEIQERLNAFKAQVMDIVQNDPSATRTSPTPGTTATPTPGSSQAPSPGVTTPTVPAGTTTADPTPTTPVTGGAAPENPAPTAEPTVAPTVGPTESAPATPAPTSTGG
ncbi:hypothetical protein D9M72_546960 [compost metagenome]